MNKAFESTLDPAPGPKRVAGVGDELRRVIELHVELLRERTEHGLDACADEICEVGDDRGAHDAWVLATLKQMTAAKPGSR